MNAAQPTIFQKIIAGDIPGVFVHQDEQCVAIMDAFPSVPGQTMVIPREPIDYIADVPDELLQHLMSVAMRITRASDAAFDTSRTCVVVEGFEVPHVHIKLYPISKTSGITSLTEVLPHTAEVSMEEREEAAAQIIKHLI